MGHLVFAGYSTDGAILIDLRRRRAIARMSRAMAWDESYCKRVIFPALLGISGASIGITVLHCACVVRQGKGLLLAGNSGSGKSTLALALARCGFEFLSDDWTYITEKEDRIKAWGLPIALKLLPDARMFFPELHQLQPRKSLNGELAYEIDPEVQFGVRRASSCEPACVVFLERGRVQNSSHGALGAGSVASELSSVEVLNRFEAFLEDLPPELSGLRASQRATIEKLSARPCRLIRYQVEPSAVARHVMQLYDSLQPVPADGLVK